MSKIKEYFKQYWLHVVFLISFSGVLGSLYISEIEKLLPCPFCWWQRVWLYPIVTISAIAIMTTDKVAKYHIFALSFIGTLFSLYQNLLQIGIFTESEACVATGTSCAKPTIFLELGSLVISLEFMALMAFLLIDSLALGYILLTRNKNSSK